MPVTIRDIAKRLGLSIASVSRALDGYPDISEETRQRVLEAAHEMNYVPNAAARQLRKHRAETVGFIIPQQASFNDPFYSEFIAGMGDEAATENYELLVAVSPDNALGEENLYRKWVSSRKVDGVVLNRIRLDDWRVKFLHSIHFPFAGLELSRNQIDYPRVEVEDRSSICEMMQKVRSGGFRRFGFLGGPKDLVIHVDRYNGFLDGLRAIGEPFNPEWIQDTDLTSSGGYRAAKRLLSIPDPPDAILCINDETAFGALHAAAEQGLIAGEQIAIAGFDGVADAQYSNPPLTTLDQPVYRIARILTRMVLQIIHGEELSEKVVTLKPELLLRASTQGTSHSKSSI